LRAATALHRFEKGGCRHDDLCLDTAMDRRVRCTRVDDSAASADSPRQLFEKYSQIGTFAWDCGKPASKDSRYYDNRVLEGNRVQRDQMSGPTTRDSVTIIEQASALGQNEFSLGGTRDGEPIEATWRAEQNRQIATEVTIGGKKVISGGKLTGNGREVPWTIRCDARAAARIYLRSATAGPAYPASLTHRNPTCPVVESGVEAERAALR
jgi:hypothetical protein